MRLRSQRRGSLKINLDPTAGDPHTVRIVGNGLGPTLPIVSLEHNQRKGLDNAQSL